MDEYKVAVLRRFVTVETCLVQRLLAGFSVFKISEPPTARRRVFFRVLDHELDIRGGPDDEGLSAWECARQDFVVVLGRDAIPMQRGDDRAVRERNRPLPESLDRYVVA